MVVDVVVAAGSVVGVMDSHLLRTMSVTILKMSMSATMTCRLGTIEWYTVRSSFVSGMEEVSAAPC